MVDMTSKCSTLPDLLRLRASLQPERSAYTFLLEDSEEVCFTYDELDRKARALGAMLQAKGAAGERALLLYPPGMDYIIAFFGCLYGGVVAVPAYPPRLNGNLGRLQAVISDSAASFALTTPAILAGIERRFADTAGMDSLTWLSTEEVADSLADAWVRPEIDSSTLAFLQYTSGSTSLPKGVMLTHGNLLHNLELIQDSFGTHEDSRGVVWLPPYHDMGLIGGILQPLFTGYPMTLMAPVDFIQRPLKWLQAISKARATVSGGPNFAYELCLQKITPEQREGLDLSAWENAFTGAEPIRAETLERFAEFFAPCGFKKEAFYPCYGLAEGTLFVSGGKKEEPWIAETFDGEALEENRVEVALEANELSRTLVSSGNVTYGNQKVLVVNPQTLLPCGDDQVGEIWVKGPSVAQGYWKREQQTKETFHACLAGSGEGPFLRTGDLGFLQNGELYVTGRLKDLIIIRGRNHYPQDIEFTVQESHPAVRNSNGAAFAVEADGEERLVVVQELERTFRKANHDEVINVIRAAIAEQHQLQVHAVVLIKPASIPKTSSGKIQRHACKNRFADGSLEVIASSILDGGLEVAAGASGVTDAEIELDRNLLLLLKPEDRTTALQAFLQQEAARVLKVAAASVQAEKSLNMLGLDSLMAVELKNQIEDSFGVVLSLTDFLDGPSIAELTGKVLERLDGGTESESNAAVVVQGPNGECKLSYGQRALWFIQHLSPENTAYNIAKAVRIRSALDVNALHETFQALTDRHPMLRTTFAEADSEPMQIVHDRFDVCFRVHDASAWSEEELAKRLNEEANTPFNLATGPIFRADLYKRGEKEHILLLNVHHILVDFWSFGVVMKDLASVYPVLQKGETLSLTEPKAAYKDYVQAHLNLLASDEGERIFAYWKKQLNGTLPVLNLPTDRPRPAKQTYQGAVRPFALSPELSERIKSLAKEKSVTLYMMLLAAYQVLLHRYSGQEDIIVGSPTVGRNSSKHADLVGYFVNPILLRANFDEDMTFAAFLDQVRETVLGALAHQDYPFALLVERLQPNRDLSFPPLCQAMFTLQKSTLPQGEALAAFALGEAGARLNLGGLELESMALEQRSSQMDLTLTMAEANGRLSGTVEFNTDLFDAATIDRMIVHFETLLAGIAADANEEVGKLPLITEAELHLKLTEWNDIEADFPQALCLHQMFEQQAERVPDNIAVAFEDKTMTYGELNVLANRLAHHLRAHGVGPDVLVGLSVERSLEMIVGILAILKAGGAYVPLDPAYPSDRIHYMLEDSQVPVLLTQQHLVEKLPEHAAKTICLDADWPLIETNSGENPDSGVRPENLAYIIYTSGSTGKPKGVLINHANVGRLFAATQHWYLFDENDVWTLFHSYAFDFSVWEIWGALLYGGKLVVVPYLVSRSPEGFYDLLVREKVTVLNQTPSAFRQLMVAEEQVGTSPGLQLRYVIFGGEALELQSLKPWYDRHGDRKPLLVNMYGITETTVHVTYRALTLEDIATAAGSVIGVPMPDLQVYVLDKHLQPVPIGVTGEMYVGGAGLARGYFKRPELTAERFIADPFSGKAGARLYKSGDLARFLPDGSLQYQGRLDHQVKIRGFRIEIGEIETALTEHPSVVETVVLARENVPGDQRLVAYLTVEPSAMLTAAELREYLREKLPEYMVPSAFLILDVFPLTNNGKVDRRALPAPEFSRDDLKQAYVAPTSETEEKLAAIWADLLHVERVGIHDNFFDLGGHSLLATQIISRIRTAFGVDLPVSRVFEQATIAELARVIDSSKTSTPKKPTLSRLSRDQHRVK